MVEIQAEEKKRITTTMDRKFGFLASFSSPARFICNPLA